MTNATTRRVAHHITVRKPREHRAQCTQRGHLYTCARCMQCAHWSHCAPVHTCIHCVQCRHCTHMGTLCTIVNSVHSGHMCAQCAHGNGAHSACMVPVRPVDGLFRLRIPVVSIVNRWFWLFLLRHRLAGELVLQWFGECHLGLLHLAVPHDGEFGSVSGTCGADLADECLWR